ncbi:unnamed protein product [Clavelina lepadiformis]|uniref:CENP-T/Histone H4 histone fold domain-containing protein n=1 Tax=Clavelina lepadiformis TaxID=159417 RepID=A0ABP0FQE0_CLALP
MPRSKNDAAIDSPRTPINKRKLKSSSSSQRSKQRKISLRSLLNESLLDKSVTPRTALENVMSEQEVMQTVARPKKQKKVVVEKVKPEPSPNISEDITDSDTSSDVFFPPKRPTTRAMERIFNAKPVISADDFQKQLEVNLAKLKKSSENVQTSIFEEDDTLEMNITSPTLQKRRIDLGKLSHPVVSAEEYGRRLREKLSQFKKKPKLAEDKSSNQSSAAPDKDKVNDDEIQQSASGSREMSKEVPQLGDVFQINVNKDIGNGTTTKPVDEIKENNVNISVTTDASECRESDPVLSGEDDLKLDEENAQNQHPKNKEKGDESSIENVQHNVSVEEDTSEMNITSPMLRKRRIDLDKLSQPVVSAEEYGRRLKEKLSQFRKKPKLAEDKSSNQSLAAPEKDKVNDDESQQSGSREMSKEDPQIGDLLQINVGDGTTARSVDEIEESKGSIAITTDVPEGHESDTILTGVDGLHLVEENDHSSSEFSLRKENEKQKQEDKKNEKEQLEEDAGDDWMSEDDEDNATENNKSKRDIPNDPPENVTLEDLQEPDKDNAGNVIHSETLQKDSDQEDRTPPLEADDIGESHPHQLNDTPSTSKQPRTEVGSNSGHLKSTSVPPSTQKLKKTVSTPSLKKLFSSSKKKAKQQKSNRSDSIIPRSQLKGIMEHYCATKLSKDAIEEVEDVFSTFLKYLARDLEAVCLHARRKTITIEDVEVVMKRQRFITEDRPLKVLIEEFLPLEYRRLFIPVAQSVTLKKEISGKKD